MTKSVVWLSKTLAILNNSFYASLRVGAEIVHAVQPGHTVRVGYVLIKYTWVINDLKNPDMFLDCYHS